MGGFYDVTNLPTFKVNNPQVAIQQGVNDFRQYQTHLYGVQNVYPNDRVLNPNTEAGSFANPGVTLTLEEVINGCAHSIRTPSFEGAFDNNGTGAFIPSQVKRYYINYLPTSLTFNTGTFFPSDYAIAANFGFKNNQGYRYYDANGVQVQTLQQSAESHLSGIPKGFGVGPNFIVGRGTEILLLWNNAYTSGQPKTSRYLLRNAYDWISAGLLLGPSSSADAYNPASTGVTGQEVPSDGVVMVPVEFQSSQWYL